ncbi:MAG: SDR family NAD(P)-dependent oxidoreductase [Sporolactobacillus sp.]
MGKAIALAYSEHGATVVCAARTDKEIQTVAEEIISKNGKALAIPTDVTSLKSIKKTFKKVKEQFGRIDILVINAGINSDRNLVEESQPEDWVETINVNLIGAYYCARSVIPYYERIWRKDFDNRFRQRT